MADVIATTEGVKAAAGISVWVPAITALAGIGGALGSQWLSHHFATARELRASEDKLARERYFIATELVFMLERFAEECARVAMDDGELVPPAPGKQCEREPTVEESKINLDGITGDWRVLDPLLMFRIRELPVLQGEANRMIRYAGENDDSPPDYSVYFHERQYQYARLGLKAAIQAKRLCRLSGLPDTRLNATQWSAQPVLWEVWRIARHRIAKEAIDNRDFRDTEFEDMAP
ncbi:hypothetical protein [Pantoea agglomerans]|uniref:hypothetical protein n=1 Tax=Enterobacter agglomerans TaxID=549 RepID=UPI003C7B52A8